MDIKKIYGDKGQYMGYLTEDSTNVRAFDAKGKPVGTYNKAANQTYNGSGGARISFGNTVVGTLWSSRS